MWLEVGKEPTEHLLNEILEQGERFGALSARIAFFLAGEEDLSNGTLRRVLERLERAEVYFDRLSAEPLARQTYVDPEKLPLVLLTQGQCRAVYACSGYNVGGAELVEQLAERLAQDPGP